MSKVVVKGNKNFIVKINSFVTKDTREMIEEKIKKDLIKQGFTVVGPECDIYVIGSDPVEVEQ